MNGVKIVDRAALAAELDRIIASLDARIEGHYVFTTHAQIPDDVEVFASVREQEAVTSVIPVTEAERLGLPTEPSYTRISIGAKTSLDMVGITSMLAQTLASREIPCNVIAGFYHDHLFVPENQAGEAQALLNALSKQAQGWSELPESA